MDHSPQGLEGMTRQPDHQTSISAATNIRARRFTLREQVEEFARASLAHGFTDDELKAARPELPESSLRKRRTELAQEKVLVETGFTRVNRHAQDEKVWMHRDYHPSPPPRAARDTTPKQSRLARAEARVADLVDIVALAFPYVEEAADMDPKDPSCPYSLHGIQRMKKLAQRMRAAVEAA